MKNAPDNPSRSQAVPIWEYLQYQKQGVFYQGIFRTMGAGPETGYNLLAKTILMKLTGYSLLPVLLLTAITSFSQQTEIVKILNKELDKETRLRLKDPDLSADTLWVITPYRIDSNVLSVTVRIKDYDNKYYTEKQEIVLNKIKAVVKDINVIFETEPDAVRITQLPQDAAGKEPAEIRYSNLFFLHLYAEKQNEALANKLVKAFGKAGLKIEKRFWYD